jgi:hypothetical protein
MCDGTPTGRSLSLGQCAGLPLASVEVVPYDNLSRRLGNTATRIEKLEAAPNREEDREGQDRKTQ